MTYIDYRAKAVRSDQYDLGEVNWTEEGDQEHHARRMFREHLGPILDYRPPIRALDVGCGQGWLCKMLVGYGAQAYGIDSSEKNIGVAQQRAPGAACFKLSLEELYHGNHFPQFFDFVSAIMVFEHFDNAAQAFYQLGSLLQPGGTLVVIHGDFDIMLTPRGSTTVDFQGDVASGEVALRTDYGQRAGVLYDIARHNTVMQGAAHEAGLQLVHNKPLGIPRWVVEQDATSQYKEGDVYFHLMVLTP